MIARLEHEYDQLIAKVHRNATFQTTQDIWFAGDDLVGRTWFSLHSERKEMAKLRKQFLPSAGLAGFTTVLGALLNLWIEERAVKLKKSVNDVWVPLSKTEGYNYLQLSQPFVRLIKHRLEKPGNSVRLTVALLQEEIEAFGRNSQTSKEFELGTEIAWRRWRELSTDA